MQEAHRVDLRDLAASTASIVQSAAEELQLLTAAARRSTWARLRRQPLAMLALLVVALVCLAALAAPLLAPHDPNFQFVTAAQAIGAGHLRILVWHIAPHLAPVAIAYATLGVGVSIPLEATLSFLNAGVPRPTASWGAVIALELIVALVVGTLAASQEGGVPDRLLTGLSALGVSLPGFWIGLMLLSLVAFRINLLPLGGDGSPLPEYLLLPAITQGVPWGFWYARILRATLLEIMGQDYLRTARGKGIGRWGFLIRHALPNAIGPVLTILAMDLGQLLGGIVVVETVFAWPGVGLQAAQALKNLDTPLVIGTLLLSGVAIAVLKLLADLVRGVLDPRIRLT